MLCQVVRGARKRRPHFVTHTQRSPSAKKKTQHKHHNTGAHTAQAHCTLVLLPHVRYSVTHSSIHSFSSFTQRTRGTRHARVKRESHHTVCTQERLFLKWLSAFLPPSSLALFAPSGHA